jgi:hypothetical protein
MLPATASLVEVLHARTADLVVDRKDLVIALPTHAIFVVEESGFWQGWAEARRNSVVEERGRC